MSLVLDSARTTGGFPEKIFIPFLQSGRRKETTQVIDLPEVIIEMSEQQQQYITGIFSFAEIRKRICFCKISIG